MQTKRITTYRRDSRAWRAVTFVLLAAFTLQTLVVQTHLHGTSTFGLSFETRLPHHEKTPAQDVGFDCPFCQAIIHSGHFVTPVAPSLTLPTIALACATLFICAIIVGRSGNQSWQSRAPPRQ